MFKVNDKDTKTTPLAVIAGWENVYQVLVSDYL